MHASTLRAATQDSITTSDGTYALTSACEFYLRHGGAIKRIDALAGFLGYQIQFSLRAREVVWVVVENGEPLQ